MHALCFNCDGNLGDQGFEQDNKLYCCPSCYDEANAPVQFTLILRMGDWQESAADEQLSVRTFAQPLLCGRRRRQSIGS